MSVLEIIIVSIGLSLDAFTVAICSGATQCSLKKAIIIIAGVIFAALQTLMMAGGMLITWFPLSRGYGPKVISINQWFSAVIFIYLGVKMLKKALTNELIDEKRENFSYKKIAYLAFATSIDALIFGIGLGLMRTKILLDMLILFIITCLFTVLGIWTGYCMGDKHRGKINLCGGFILIIIGIKMVVTYFKLI